MFSRRHLPFQIFILAFVAAMFFPRVLPEGMFPDGLTYSSIARNMAEGRGGFWSPYFSSSFWIPFQGNEYQFYGHPTLTMGILSLFFHVFGDHWFVEKGFNIIVWGITIWLVIKLWQVNAKDKNLWWLPMFAWYWMPTVLWSYPQYILDNSMAVFSLAATLLIIKNGKIRIKNARLDTTNAQFLIFNFPFLIPAGLLLHLAFWTKGPVGLYPLAMPLIYWFFYKEKTTLRTAALQTAVLTITCFGTLALWYLYEPARFFWTKYFDVQLLSSISDNDQTESYSWKDYFYLPQQLILQALPMLGIALIFYIFSKIKKAPFVFEQESNRLAAFYFAIAMSGSLPMMISHKISAFYLVPCLPFLAMSFAAFFEPSLINWFEKYKISPSKTQKANGSMAFLSVCVAIYCFSLVGTVGRERDIIHDMHILRGVIPDGSKICVSDSMMKHFNYHAYFQRYHRWELAKLSDTIPRFFVASKGFCKPTEQDSVNLIFKKLEIKDMDEFDVFERK